jgi:hypothetical protein
MLPDSHAPPQTPPRGSRRTEGPRPPLLQDLADAVFHRTGFRAYVLTLRPWGFHLEATHDNQGQRLWPFPGERKPPTAHAHASAGGQAILAHLRRASPPRPAPGP